MINMKILVVYCAIFIAFASAGKIQELPSFFKTCSASDPKLSECIMQKSKETLPELLKGVKEFKVPSFLPLKLKLVEVNAGRVVIKLMDFEIHGLDSAELTKVSMDMAKHSSSGTIVIKQLQINGTYDVDGKILVLPITGHGPGFIQFDDVIIEAELSFELVEMPEDKQYHFVKLDSLKIKYTPGKEFFKFDNLFNGDKKLGDEMNAFLNENWQEFNKDIEPAVISVIETVVVQIVGRILELVPIEKMIPQ